VTSNFGKPLVTVAGEQKSWF